MAFSLQVINRLCACIERIRSAAMLQHKAPRLISPFISGAPFVSRNISAAVKHDAAPVIHMLNVPRCRRRRRRRNTRGCAENKRFQLSNFPSLSQLSLSSAVASRALALACICMCATLYANNECTGWAARAHNRETPRLRSDRPGGPLVARSRRSVARSRASP